MIRTTLISLVVLAAGAFAQPPESGRGRGHFGPPPGPEMQGRAMGGGRILAAEAGMPGHLVKNAPYSADIVTETSQALADGNHIRQTTTVHFYRDSEGRTRREQPLRTLNGLAPNANLPSVVFINDPVAGVNYALNPTEKTASETQWTPRGGPGPGPGGRMQGRGGPPPQGGAMQGFRRGGGANENVKTDSLGRQTIEGVPADGTRVTMTIPAGQIGNEQPLQVVTESWYSPDLQTVVLLKRTDPRMGETVTRVTNISRAEPSRTLFEVPSDFQVTDRGRR
jgi:hypothetical protein